MRNDVWRPIDMGRLGEGRADCVARMINLSNVQRDCVYVCLRMYEFVHVCVAGMLRRMYSSFTLGYIHVISCMPLVELIFIDILLGSSFKVLMS